MVLSHETTSQRYVVALHLRPRFGSYWVCWCRLLVREHESASAIGCLTACVPTRRGVRGAGSAIRAADYPYSSASRKLVKPNVVGKGPPVCGPYSGGCGGLDCSVSHGYRRCAKRSNQKANETRQN